MTCGTWTYWNAAVRAHYVFWGTAAFPCGTAQVADESTGAFAWTLYFTDFQAGPPPDAAFGVTPGVECPAATDPTWDDNYNGGGDEAAGAGTDANAPSGAPWGAPHSQWAGASAHAIFH